MTAPSTQRFHQCAPLAFSHLILFTPTWSTVITRTLVIRREQVICSKTWDSLILSSTIERYWVWKWSYFFFKVLIVRLEVAVWILGSQVRTPLVSPQKTKETQNYLKVKRKRKKASGRNFVFLKYPHWLYSVFLTPLKLGNCSLSRELRFNAFLPGVL